MVRSFIHKLKEKQQRNQFLVLYTVRFRLNLYNNLAKELTEGAGLQVNSED